MGTVAGWMTRRRRQAEMEREWDDALSAIATRKERERLMPLLRRCESVITRAMERYSIRDGATLLKELRAEITREP